MTPVPEVVPFGTLSQADASGRRDVSLVALRSTGASITVLTYGAMLWNVETPDRTGRTEHVALHLPSLLDIEDRARNPYLGATCGRYANRIAGASFALDGVDLDVHPNDGPNQLHGGPDGFDRRLWDVAEVASNDDGGHVVLALTSAHGDQGFPGTLQATATYELHGHTLRIVYTATTDAPTVVNLTNHTYWHLGGPGAWTIARSVGEHELRIPATRYLPVDGASLPDGALADVAGTPFDLRHDRPLGDLFTDRPDGLDHAYEVPTVADHDPAAIGGLPLAAELHHPASGRTLTVATDQPAVQVYTANGLGGSFAPQAAICLETQRFPDAPNRADLGPSVLRHGEHYRSTTDLTFGWR